MGGVTGVVVPKGANNPVVHLITVQFGSGGQSIGATPDGTGRWSCSGSVSSDAPDGALTISASGSVTYPLPGGGEIQYETDPISQTQTVTLSFHRQP